MRHRSKRWKNTVVRKLIGSFRAITSILAIFFKEIPWFVFAIIPVISFGIIYIFYTTEADVSNGMVYSIVLFGLLSIFFLIVKLLINLSFRGGSFSIKPLKYTAILIVILLGFAVLEEINAWKDELNIRLTQVERRFGSDTKLKCSPKDLPGKLKSSVVRIIGNNMEGTGFFIDTGRIITNFHVIDEEPSPKVVYADNTFEKPIEIVGNKEVDLAVLTVGRNETPLKSLTISNENTYFGEPVYSVGYPRGSNIPGPPLLSAGTFAGTREALNSHDPELVVTNASLIPGMSGGPLVDACGSAIAINTMGEPGMGFYINLVQALARTSAFTANDVADLKVDPMSPEGAVRAFYDLINAAKWLEAYNLLTPEKRRTDSFDNWQNGYNNTLHVDVVKTVPEKDKVKVKIFSRDWVDGNIVSKYFEGEWETVFAGDVWNLSDSTIKEIPEPNGYSWYWE